MGGNAGCLVAECFVAVLLFVAAGYDLLDEGMPSTPMLLVVRCCVAVFL